MKVLFLTSYILSDRATPGSSTEVRILPLAKELEKHGIVCEFLESKIRTSSHFKEHIFSHSLRKFLRTLLDNKEDFDILFISRISSFLTYLIAKRVKEKVVFDLDDPVFLPSRKMLGLKLRSPYFSCVEKIMNSSEAVTVSSHFILAYAENFNHKSFLIHTPVDTKEFNPLIRKRSEKFTVGWVGNAYAHQANLEMLRRPLVELGRRYDVRFKMVSYLGSMSVKSAFKKVEEHVEVNYGSENWVPFNRLPRHICDFDVLVSPLRRNLWFEGKSAVKVATGMAIGTPVVASSVGEQKYVIQHGLNGFIAGNEEEWYLYLKTLVENSKLRNRMGIEARKTAEEELSVEVNGGKLQEITESLASK